MTDYKAIARAITDSENQPHQWNDQELAKFFVSAADEIERLREALKKIDLATSVYALKNIPEIVSQLARSALQQKESE